MTDAYARGTDLSNPRRRGSLVLVAAACMVTIAAVTGCNYGSLALYVIKGTPKQPAVFTLDSKRTAVFFIDDRNNKVPRRALRRAAAQAAEQTLLKSGAMKPEMLIDSRAARIVADAEHYDEPLSVVEIGRRAGADIMIYATIERWTLSPDGETYGPVVEARIKITDAENNTPLWPGTANGYTLTVEMPYASTEPPSTRTERAKLERQLAERFGAKLAQLFFKHPKERLSEQRIETGGL